MKINWKIFREVSQTIQLPLAALLSARIIARIQSLPSILLTHKLLLVPLPVLSAKMVFLKRLVLVRQILTNNSINKLSLMLKTLPPSRVKTLVVAVASLILTLMLLKALLMYQSSPLPTLIFKKIHSHKITIFRLMNYLNPSIPRPTPRRLL